MKYNAYILDWTMNDYGGLKQEITEAGFDFVKEKGKNHIRVEVQFVRLQEFVQMMQGHLNAPYNYVDTQFPKEKKTVIVFSERMAVISNAKENEAVKQWAIAKGLPPQQADWRTSY